MPKFYSALLLALFVTLPSYAAVPQSSDSPYGMNNRDWTAADVKELKAAHVGWARVKADWSKVEAEAGKADWSVTDAAVGELEKGGLRILLTLHNTPAWAKAADSDLPDPAKFGAFAKAAAERYKGRVSAYEMLNEENTALGPRVADRRASTYVPILQAGYNAVKSADPGATVLMAGMWGFPVHYLEDLYRAGAKGSFDAISLHYTLNLIEGGPRFFDSFRGDLPFLLRYLRAVAKSHGDDKPIWITDIGWSVTTGNETQAVTEDQQADYLAYAYDQAMRSGAVEKVFWSAFHESNGAALIFRVGQGAPNGALGKLGELGLNGPAPGTDVRGKAYEVHNTFAAAHPAWKPGDVKPWTPPKAASKAAAITNPGFENRLNGWQALRNAKVDIDSTTAHSGKWSLKVSTPDGSAARAAQGGIPVEGGRLYEVTGWVKMTGGAKDPRYARAMIEVQAWGEGEKSLNVTGPLYDRRAGEQISTNYYISETEGQWYQIHYPFFMPNDAKTANIGLRLDYGPGEAWFDDIRIAPLKLSAQ